MRRLGAGQRVRVSCLGAPLYMLSSLVCLHVLCLIALKLTFSAELLVEVVDVVLDGSGIDEKFLGVTIFALVPNTTEFMNAISFALNGNISLRWVLRRSAVCMTC